MDVWFFPSLKIFVGLTILIVGGELLVRGATWLAAALRISPLVIGLTVVAFGTSSPELAVCLQSALTGNADIALGNVVGSNILNVLLILGISALVIPLVVSSRLIRWDVPIMILASLLLALLGLDGKLGRIDGCLMFGGLLAYLYWCIRASRSESREIAAEFAQETPVVASRPGTAGMVLHVLLIVAGLALLGLGSNWLIDGSVFIATRLGISKLIIGLTIIAAGTSLPEVVTSIVAACRGERDIAVGNVVGSNLFNILGVLGLSSILAPEGIAVAPGAMRFDIPVMIVVAVACLPIFFSGNQIARWEGGLFFGYYIAYTTYLVLEATQSVLTPSFATVMIVFVIPLTLITLTVGVVRHAREQSVASPADGDSR